MKSSQFADDMILCKGESKEYTNGLLEFIREFDQAAGDKINPEKSIAFMYRNSAKAEKELVRSVSLAIATKI